MLEVPPLIVPQFNALVSPGLALRGLGLRYALGVTS